MRPQSNPLLPVPDLRTLCPWEVALAVGQRLGYGARLGVGDGVCR